MKKLIRLIGIISLVFISIYLFAGYVLVPHPDYLEHYISSIQDKIRKIEQQKM